MSGSSFGLVQPWRSSLKASGPWVSLNTAGFVSAGLGRLRVPQEAPVTSGDNGHCEGMDPPPPPGSHIRSR